MGDRFLKTPLTRTLFFNLVNSGEEFLRFARRREEDPAFQPLAGRSSLGETASWIRAHQRAEGEPVFSELEDLLEVEGIGEEDLRPLVRGLRSLPVEEKILLLLNTAPRPEVLVEEIRSREGPGVSGLSPALAQELLQLRLQQPERRFESLAALESISAFEDRVLDPLVYTFEVDAAKDTGAVERARLASALKAFLGPEDPQRGILGSESVSSAVGRLAGRLDEEEGDNLRELLQEAVEKESVASDERVADVVLFPQISDFRVRAPDGVRDPVSIPGAPPRHAWFRTAADLVLNLPRGGTLEVLGEEGWKEPIPIRGGVRVRSVRGGVEVQRVVGERLTRLGRAGRMGGRPGPSGSPAGRGSKEDCSGRRSPWRGAWRHPLFPLAGGIPAGRSGSIRSPAFLRFWQIRNGAGGATSPGACWWGLGKKGTRDRRWASWWSVPSRTSWWRRSPFAGPPTGRGPSLLDPGGSLREGDSAGREW